MLVIQQHMAYTPLRIGWYVQNQNQIILVHLSQDEIQYSLVSNHVQQFVWNAHTTLLQQFSMQYLQYVGSMMDMEWLQKDQSCYRCSSTTAAASYLNSSYSISCEYNLLMYPFEVNLTARRIRNDVDSLLRHHAAV